MTRKILRPDQEQLKYGIYNGWNAGHRNVMAQAATGFGKSVVMSTVAREMYEAHMRFPVIAHRNELVSQMSHHIAEQDIPHRIIGSEETTRLIVASHRKKYGMSYVHPTERTSVAGIGTMNARRETLVDWGKQQDYAMGDEGHHFLRENIWGRGIAMLTNARVLLVTATPGRPDGCGLGRGEFIEETGKWTNDGIVDHLVFGPEMRWLIDNRCLSDYEIVCPTSDLHLEESDITDGGDYSPKKLKAAAEKSKIVGDVVREYCRYAIGKRAICFATDVETSNKIAKQFNDAGIRAASVSAKTPQNVREKYIDEFKTGHIKVLVNVDLFDEGFDVPACEVVIMARPTASIVKYLQMFGRALRVMAGKLYGLIIDHVSNVIRHGLPDKPRFWSLDRREKRGKSEPDPEEIPLTRCLNMTPPACGKQYERFHSHCPHCGWEPPLPEPGARTIKMVDGDMTLLDRAALEEKRRATFLEDPASLAQRVASAAGGAGAQFHMNKQIAKIQAQTALRAAIEQWAGCERAKGRPDDQTYRRFYLTLGVDPLEAIAADRTREQYEAMTQTIKGWYER